VATEQEYLVLSKLAYVDYNRIAETSTTTGTYIGSSIDNFNYSVSNRPQVEEWRNDLNQMSDWQIINYTNNNNTTGYCGVAFRNTVTNEIIIANRGTEPDVQMNTKIAEDFITDAQLALAGNPRRLSIRQP
jgi:ABC-type oligopeptide transport system substrate-binding subunit